MDEPSDRVAELREQAADVRARAIEANGAMVAELTGIWNELNGLAAGHPDVRRLRDHVAADIARLEKLALAFETEWLADVRRDRP